MGMLPHAGEGDFVATSNRNGGLYRGGGAIDVQLNHVDPLFAQSGRCGRHKAGRTFGRLREVTKLEGWNVRRQTTLSLRENNINVPGSALWWISTT